MTGLAQILPTRHLREGETIPAPDKTKQRIGRYIEDSLAGKDHEDVRGLAIKAIRAGTSRQARRDSYAARSWNQC